MHRKPAEDTMGQGERVGHEERQILRGRYLAVQVVHDAVGAGDGVVVCHLCHAVFKRARNDGGLSLQYLSLSQLIC